MQLLLCVILAPLPSIIWLAFYLRKDKHPEPNRLVIKIFLLGILMVPIAAILEQMAYVGINKTPLANQVIVLMVVFALIEELLKYFAVKFGALKSPDFDEPVDAMIYMIIAALGFAAAENIYLLSQISPLKISIGSTIEFIATRFFGATLLHTLASAIMGYFISASMIINSKIRRVFRFGGLIAATILHSVFNYIIILNVGDRIEVYQRNIALLVLLLGTGIMVSLMFRKINKFRAVCKV
jgi:RsiW-degrading membrane proteinase PrsW (M82 family)